MKFWTRLRLRAVSAVLRMFRRQTEPVHRLPLAPEEFEPLSLPLERTVEVMGRKLTLLGRTPAVLEQDIRLPDWLSRLHLPGRSALAFPLEVYTQAINAGVARDAEWAHVVTIGRSPFNPPDSPPNSPPDSPLSSPLTPPPEFLLHAASRHGDACR